MTRVLIVDDESSIREFLYSILTDAGYVATTAADGAEALRIPGPWSVLLTDVLMPRMTGDELARQMRQGDPNLKVLYLTAYSDRLFDAKHVLWDGEAFLEKPVTATAVLEAIELLLRDRRTVRTV